MQLGVGVPSFASRSFRIPPSRVKRFARRAEEFEFAGLWTIEHLVRPPTYATSYLDSLTTLATLAGETDAVPLGTSILILPMREPVLVAKRAATIQHLADRRLTLGFGTGYVKAEFDAVGVPREERSARFLEGIELVRRSSPRIGSRSTASSTRSRISNWSRDRRSRPGYSPAAVAWTEAANDTSAPR